MIACVNKWTLSCNILHADCNHNDAIDFGSDFFNDNTVILDPEEEDIVTTLEAAAVMHQLTIEAFIHDTPMK